MNTHLKTQDIVVIGISAALYAVFGILTAGFSFLGVGFLPAVVIPAVFAVLYGPWVGGLGAAIGIFIRDMFVHGNPALSLVAGVPANFIVFFIIGYIALRTISLKQALAGITIAAVGLLVPTIVFLPDFTATFASHQRVTSLQYSQLTVILTLAIIAVVAIRWKEWRSYAIGAVVGQALGAALLSVTVCGCQSTVSLDTSEQLTVPQHIIPIFVWTFATEVPFVLLVGPPIIKVCLPSISLSKKKGQTK